MLDVLTYSFIVRGLEAGIIIAIIAPVIGTFLVLRRYSLIADTLAHVSLAGVAIGLLLQLNPIVTALISSLVSSVVIEKLRASQRVYSESALSLFLSGSLAVAVILISLAKGFTGDIFNYLFGSIVTVTSHDVGLIALVGVGVLVLVTLFYKELLYTTFDEEGAQVSGIPVGFINLLLITLAAVTISIAIPIVGVLLISALMVIPVLTALQFRVRFGQTLVYAVLFSLLSVVSGIFVAFELNIATGGTIVVISLLMFAVSLLFNRR